MSWYGSRVGFTGVGSTDSTFIPRCCGSEVLSEHLRETSRRPCGRAAGARALDDRNDGSDDRHCAQITRTDRAAGAVAERAIARHFL